MINEFFKKREFKINKEISIEDFQYLIGHLFKALPKKFHNKESCMRELQHSFEDLKLYNHLKNYLVPSLELTKEKVFSDFLNFTESKYLYLKDPVGFIEMYHSLSKEAQNFLKKAQDEGELREINLKYISDFYVFDNDAIISKNVDARDKQREAKRDLVCLSFYLTVRVYLAGNILNVQECSALREYFKELGLTKEDLYVFSEFAIENHECESIAKETISNEVSIDNLNEILLICFKMIHKDKILNKDKKDKLNLIFKAMNYDTVSLDAKNYFNYKYRSFLSQYKDLTLETKIDLSSLVLSLVQVETTITEKEKRCITGLFNLMDLKLEKDKMAEFFKKYLGYLNSEELFLAKINQMSFLEKIITMYHGLNISYAEGMLDSKESKSLMRIWKSLENDLKNEDNIRTLFLVHCDSIITSKKNISNNSFLKHVTSFLADYPFNDFNLFSNIMAVVHLNGIATLRDDAIEALYALCDRQISEHTNEESILFKMREEIRKNDIYFSLNKIIVEAENKIANKYSLAIKDRIRDILKEGRAKCDYYKFLFKIYLKEHERFIEMQVLKREFTDKAIAVLEKSANIPKVEAELDEFLMGAAKNIDMGALRLGSKVKAIELFSLMNHDAQGNSEKVDIKKLNLELNDRMALMIDSKIAFYSNHIPNVKDMVNVNHIKINKNFRAS